MNLHTTSQYGSDSIQHSQRMSFIIRILESADRGSSCPYQLSQLPLCKTSTQAESQELPCYTITHPNLLKRLEPRRPSLVIATIQNLYCIRCATALAFCHIHFSRYVCASGSCSKRRFRSNATRMSLSGTSRSLTRP